MPLWHETRTVFKEDRLSHKIFWLSAIAAGIALSPFSFAAVEEEAGAGAVTKAVAPAARPLIAIDLFGWSASTAFSNLNGLKASPDGAATSPIDIVSQFTIHTPAIGAFDFAVTPEIVIQPMQGQRFRANDPMVGLQGVVYSSGGLTYWARYESSVPVSPGSYSEGLITTTQAINVLSYQFPQSRFRLDTVIIPSVKSYTNAQAKAGIYLSPRLFYRVSDSFSFMSIIETGLESKRGSQLYDLYQGGFSSIGAGFRYTSNNGKGLWVQPFLNTFPFGRRVAESTHLAVLFGGPLL